ncbi:hypothetical protein A2U01_0075420, partial [Trifolium medium]|nr:hypothetical protein [Trifolium medium]
MVAKGTAATLLRTRPAARGTTVGQARRETDCFCRVIG